MFTVDDVEFESLEQFCVCTEMNVKPHTITSIRDKRISDKTIALFLLGRKKIRNNSRPLHYVIYNRKQRCPMEVIKEVDVALNIVEVMLKEGKRYEDIRLRKQLNKGTYKELPNLRYKEIEVSKYPKEVPVEQLRLGKHILTTTEYKHLKNELDKFRREEAIKSNDEGE